MLQAAQFINNLKQYFAARPENSFVKMVHECASKRSFHHNSPCTDGQLGTASREPRDSQVLM